MRRQTPLLLVNQQAASSKQSVRSSAPLRDGKDKVNTVHSHNSSRAALSRRDSVTAAGANEQPELPKMYQSGTLQNNFLSTLVTSLDHDLIDHLFQFLAELAAAADYQLYQLALLIGFAVSRTHSFLVISAFLPPPTSFHISASPINAERWAFWTSTQHSTPLHLPQPPGPSLSQLFATLSPHPTLCVHCVLNWCVDICQRRHGSWSCFSLCSPPFSSSFSSPTASLRSHKSTSSQHSPSPYQPSSSSTPTSPCPHSNSATAAVRPARHSWMAVAGHSMHVGFVSRGTCTSHCSP